MWLLAFLACDSGPPPTTHGTILHVGTNTVLVRHDDLRGRVVTGVERYQIGRADLEVGTISDLWLDGTTVVRAEVTGTEPDLARPHPLRGTVVNVDGIRVMVDHEPVPDVMDAMVMGFGLAPWEVDGLTTGDTLSAGLLATDYGWQLVDPVKTGHVDTVARSDVAPLEVGEILPAVELTSHAGKPLTIGGPSDEATLVTFIYTRCPDPSFCPAIAARLSQLQRELKGGRIVTVSLDPDNDTPAVLAAWGKAMGADFERWTLARAEPVVLQNLALRAGQHVTIDGARISHLHRVLILDKEGRLIERYDDNAWPSDRVVEQLSAGSPRAESTGTKSAE